MEIRYKPMLAYPVSSKPVPYGELLFIQPKLDGVRCLIQHDLDSDGIHHINAFSRTGKKWLNIQHILDELVPFFRENPDVVLDGELYNHDLNNDFEKIISLVRRTKPTYEDRLESSRMVQFHCYDVILDNEVRKPWFEIRKEWVSLNVPPSHCVKIVETHELWHEKYAKTYHDINLKNGYEGSILRLNEPYHNKRSHNLRKFKDFHDAEAEIIGWVQGKGKRVGTIGKFIARDPEGIEFGMPVMDKFKTLQEKYDEMKGWVGKTATFTYFERTKANSYRHPLFKCIRDYE